MKHPLVHKILAPFLIAVMLLAAGCGNTQTPSRWDKAQQESTQKPAKTQSTSAQKPSQTQNVQDQKLPSKAVSGSKLNRYFPAGGDGYNRVFTQEKSGFAEAKLNRGNKTVAMLSINDLAGNPSAATKFKQSTQKIGGYPAVKQGNTTTAVLVANRYQVKAQSRDTSFSAEDRQNWLQKFNLSGLASLK